MYSLIVVDADAPFAKCSDQAIDVPVGVRITDEDERFGTTVGGITTLLWGRARQYRIPVNSKTHYDAAHACLPSVLVLDAPDVLLNAS